MRIFVDSSALIAHLDRDDRNHNRAIETFRSAAARDVLVTHNYVVVESAALLRVRFRAEDVRTLLEDLIPAMRVTWVDQATHQAAISAHLGSLTRKVSLVDWVSFEVMRRSRITTAFTFDRDFRAQGFEVVP
ncbi:MAG: PIN domain-containing protein [Actinomycetota bacterium]